VLWGGPGLLRQPRPLFLSLFTQVPGRGVLRRAAFPRRLGKENPSWSWADLELTVIAPPPGELFSETNDNSVAILLSYGTARVLLSGDTQAREEHMAGGTYTRP
jgi:beta-lactamase superfamily II metal-dependent hydrolase